MKCTKVEPIIIELVRGQLVDSRLRDETLAHIEQCISCAARLSAQRMLVAGVHAVVESIHEQGASARVEVALRKAMRDRIYVSTTPSARKFYGLPRWAMAAAAIAGVLLFVLLIGVFRLTATRTDQEHSVETILPTNDAFGSNNQNSFIATSKTTKREKDSVSNNSAPQTSTVSRNQMRRRARVLMDKESTTDFYLLADEGEHVPLESGQVVRVRLPLSSFVPGELSEGADADDKLITADLVIGQDGLARAVRFVR